MHTKIISQTEILPLAETFSLAASSLICYLLEALQLHLVHCAIIPEQSTVVFEMILKVGEVTEYDPEKKTVVINECMEESTQQIKIKEHHMGRKFNRPAIR